MEIFVEQNHHYWKVGKINIPRQYPSLQIFFLNINHNTMK